MQDQVAEPLEKQLEFDHTSMAGTYTRPGMALITLSLQNDPPSEVPEQFYQARKKLGMRRKTCLPASPAR